MNIRTSIRRSGLTALLYGALLLLSAQAGAAIKLSLSGQGAPSDVGFGGHGLFLGDDFSNNVLNHSYTNWTWSDLEMTIETNGDANINGTMTRAYHSEVWGINIDLGNIEFRKANGGYKNSQNWSGNVDEQSFLDLAQGINPFTGADQSGNTGWGFEWKNLSMTLDKMGNSSSVPETGWQGFAMPDMGHALVAELHYDGARGLTFEAWYKNPQTHSWYDVGDTKAVASITQGHSEVPEPTTLLLLSAGLFGVGFTRVRKKA